MDIIAVVITVVAGFFGSAILGANMYWSDAGAIIEVAVMGFFILRTIKKLYRKQQELPAVFFIV